MNQGSIEKNKRDELLPELTVGEKYFPALQRLLYSVAGIYSVFIDANGIITSNLKYDHVSERDCIIDFVGNGLLEKEAKNVVNNFVEEIIPVNPSSDVCVCQGIVLRIGGRPKGVCFLIGVIDQEESQSSEHLKYTDMESFEKAVNFSRQLLSVFLEGKTEEFKASLLYQQERENGIQKEEDFIRTALITDIVQMLESDKDIVEVVSEILELVCKHLNMDHARLYRIDDNNKTVSAISEWAISDEYRILENEQGRPISEYPFMGEDNFIISSNTALKEEQQKFMDKYDSKALIVFPVILHQRVIMYLLFGCKGERVWKMADVRFISDVRKIVQSIIAKRVSQNSLSSSFSSLEQILNNIGCGVLVVDPDRRLPLFENHNLPEDIYNELAKIKLADCFAHGEKHAEIELLGCGKWIEINMSMIRWVDDRDVELYTIFDISEVKNYKKNIEKSNNSDLLTGLFNRMRCEQDLEVYLKLAKENKGHGAVFFIDLDDFKNINDGLGHQYGDILLKAISSNLRKIKGIESTCYRVGGDEFVAIVSDNNYDKLNDIISGVEEIFSHPWYLKGSDYYCTMSMGVCQFPGDADTVEDVIRKADVALSEAKKSGKNRVEYYAESETEGDLSRLDMEKFMRDACMNPEEEFEVYYQPIMDISKNGNRCVGAEALIRWNSKSMGRVMPSEFVPLAEYLGLIKPIGDFVLYEACKRCKYWNDMGHPDYKVNVNFSVVQLLQPDMESKIESVLKETGLNPKNLTVEVTESLAINDISYMKRLLGSIRRLGVRIALDDFGTGYSSLNHIREIPLDIIKVDRCFIQDVGRDEYSQVFIKMISELAGTLGLNVCVEGVEDAVQYQIMKENNVDMIQGYYFAEPMPLDEFETKFIDGV